jgi:hypothetical protein
VKVKVQGRGGGRGIGKVGHIQREYQNFTKALKSYKVINKS